MTKRQLTSLRERSPRRVALRDLRFAGSIAAGLVAAILIAGALAAPMVGWSDWPTARDGETSAGGGALTLTAPARTNGGRSDNSPFSGSRGEAAGESASNPLALPGLGPVAAAPTTGGGTVVGVTVPRGGSGGGDDTPVQGVRG